ncbi:MAG: hypothetical protein Aurels2KO_19210 [Aureliella sp.]
MVVSQFRNALRVGLAVAVSAGSIAVAQDGTLGRDAEPTVSKPAENISLVSSASNRNLSGFAGYRTEVGLQDRSAEIASPSDLPSETTQILSSSIRVSDVSTDKIGSGRVPPAGELPGGQIGLPDGVMRGASWKCVHWAPSSICHYPLYFEDAMLERHGHEKYCRLQPLISGAKFFAAIPLLPYKQALQGPAQPVYTLGHYRAASPAPALRQRLPWDRNAAAIEALTLGGLFWAAPL